MNLIVVKRLFDNPYIAAVSGIAGISFFLKYLQIIFGSSPPLLLFLIVITFAAWAGGLGAGLFTTVLSATASAFFLAGPYGSFAIFKSNEMVRIELLVIVGAICSLIIAQLHKREKRALHAVLERQEQLKLEIAERNRTQAERDLYITLAKSSTEFIGMCDIECMPFFINDAGLRLVGLDSLEQGLKTPVKEFFFPEDQAFIMDEFFPSVLKNGRAEGEIRLRHFKTGEAVWIIHNAFTLKDSNDKIVGLGTVSTNITARKQAEDALRLLDRRKDEFLAMLAHELRNPLAPIQNAVQVLKMQKTTDPKLTSCQNIIDRQVIHMTLLLDDLLDVARIMQGKIRLKAEHLDLAEIVNHAVETSRPLIESRGQKLTISEPMTPLWIEGDHARLVQVLSNLLHNAAKYTNEGGIITLSVIGEGTAAIIEVKDTGIGIAPDILSHIFDLFIQADHSLAHSQGGLGIGLTLVRQLVELHGGEVEAASAGIGRGSTFTVRLPTLSMVPSANESVVTESMELTPKFRVLVVDDYTDSAFSSMLLLQMEGHEVETADCGMKAIERAQILRPQVVLLDIGLPDLDGYEVAKRLRELPETRDAILIALTGYGQTEDRTRSQSIGFNHHLLKPMDFKKLSALLASL